VPTQLDVVDRLSGLSETDLQFRSRAELEGFREQLRTARDNAFEACKRIEDTAAGRPLTAPQRSDFDAATRRVADAGHLVEAVEHTLALKQIDYSQLVHVGGGDLTADDARSLLTGSPDRYDGGPLTRTQTFTGAVRAAGLVRDGEEQLSLGRYLRGVVVGDWRGADPERRAMSEGVLASGGYLVPTILSAEIIDRARNQTRVLQAGARLIPMPNRTLDVAKWVTDPTPAWHSENAAITPSDGTIGKVTLTAQALAGLKPAFRQGGTITAGNAAGLNDGAAALVLASEAKARELGIEPLGAFVGSAVAGVDPRVMGIGPVPAARKLLDRLEIEPADLDLVELNEAFASQSLAVIRELGLNPEKVNVNGGAIAMGHPLGMSGARLVVSLLHELGRRDGRYGLATLCVGVGQGQAALFER